MWKRLPSGSKKWVRASLILTLLVIVGIGWWAEILDQRVSAGLRDRKFLPPTQYFSAPNYIYPQMQVTKEQVVAKLHAHGYVLKTLQDRLRPGEYAVGSAADCAQQLSSSLPNGSQSCVVSVANEVGDPELKQLGLQMLIFGDSGFPLQAYHGNPLVPADAFVLEPQLVAQYLGKEPIQQNYTTLGEIPVTCLNAVLAIEDPRFLQHSGVSFLGIARAAFRNMVGSRFRQGGSTITQQLVKNYFLNAEPTLKRKATEFLMSLILESHASKDEILETYLNVIYLGQNGPFQVRGFPAAARYYFAKKIQDLELPECATLAAVLNSPGLYDPFRKPENASKRRALVLDKMLEQNLISANEAVAAKNTPLPQKAQLNIAETAPYYIDAVQKEMAELSLPTEGTKIFTGLDLETQAQAQTSVQQGLARLEKENKFVHALQSKGKTIESALLSANNKTGLIQSIVGGRAFKLTQFNRAIEGHRQVGSVMKPFVYLTALESSPKQWTPTTLLHDVRFQYEYANQKWSPENYTHKFMGDVPMYVALKDSLNSATAALGLQVGLDKIISVGQAVGMQSRLEPVPSLTLGAFELFPREVLQSYTTLAGFGELHRLRTLRYVVSYLDADNVIYHADDVRETAVSPVPTAVLVGMMKQTLISGSAKGAAAMGFTAPAAGKTGTTSEYKDAWFAGFTPFITTVVWVGYDDNSSANLTGTTGALPIWVDYMKAVNSAYPAVDFTWPDGVVERETTDGVKLVFVRD